jgi:biopolymer transport protein ExbB/TolQ
VSEEIYRAIYHVAAVLEVPVIVLALVALAVVVVEFGAFVAEVARRRRRRLVDLTSAAEAAHLAASQGLRTAAADALAPIAWSGAMGATLDAFAGVLADRSDSEATVEPRIAKLLADFDFTAQRRLGRTRLLVRLGPALGLMGTLIPLSPALEGLARGDIATLTDNLQTAFSITVLGLLVGVLAFALSLVRERLYAQDYSDLEYVAALLTDDAPTTATS